MTLFSNIGLVPSAALPSHIKVKVHITQRSIGTPLQNAASGAEFVTTLIDLGLLQKPLSSCSPHLDKADLEVYAFIQVMPMKSLAES
jgi:hypothetical protein